MIANNSGHAFASLFSHVREPVAVIDEFGNVLYHNPAARRLFFRVDLSAPGAKNDLFQQARSQVIALISKSAQSHHNDPMHVRNHIAQTRWLISVTTVSRNLAVLHAVFIVRIISWRRLQRISVPTLCNAFGISTEKMPLVIALSSPSAEDLL